MTGRDIIKFIIHNKLVDKECVKPGEDVNILEFIDYLQSDDIVHYYLSEVGESTVIHYSFEDASPSIVSQCYVDDIYMNSVKTVDSFQSDDLLDIYNEYDETFRQWMKTLGVDNSITSLILNYAESDANLSNNCRSLNKLVSYLEGKGVDREVIQSAEIAWRQYMRECRDI